MSGIEILGIAASVIQIADAGARLSSKLFVFTRKVKDADRSIQDISREIAATGAALRELGEALEQDKYASLGSKHSFTQTTQIVADCWESFTEINETIGGEKLIKGRDATNEKVSNAVAKFKQPSLSFKQRFKFPFKEPQIHMLRSKLESLKSSLVLMLQVLLLAEQVRNRPKAQVSDEQKELIKTLVDEKNARDLEFKTSCMAMDAPPADDLQPELEKTVTVDSSSSAGITPTEPLLEGPAMPKAGSLAEAEAPVNVALTRTVPMVQENIALVGGPPAPEELGPSRSSLKWSSSKSSFMSSSDTLSSFSNDPSVPSSLRIRDEEIQHHAVLVHNLLEEISDVQYRIDHGIRHRMHDGILKIHWDEWIPFATKYGQSHFHRAFEHHKHVARYWLDLQEGVNHATPTPPTTKKFFHFRDATNRHFDLPYEQCNKWLEMTNFISHVFDDDEQLKDVVSAGQYSLFTEDRKIIVPRFWEATVEPGMNILMEMKNSYPVKAVPAHGSNFPPPPAPPIPTTIAPTVLRKINNLTSKQSDWVHSVEHDSSDDSDAGLFTIPISDRRSFELGGISPPKEPIRPYLDAESYTTGRLELGSRFEDRGKVSFDSPAPLLRPERYTVGFDVPDTVLDELDDASQRFKPQADDVLSQAQIDLLRDQIFAFKILSRDGNLSDKLKEAIASSERLHLKHVPSRDSLSESPRDLPSVLVSQGQSLGAPSGLAPLVEECSPVGGICPDPSRDRHFKDLKVHTITHKARRSENFPTLPDPASPVSEISTDPSVIQGPVGSHKYGQRYHWQHTPTLPAAKDEILPGFNRKGVSPMLEFPYVDFDFDADEMFPFSDLDILPDRNSEEKKREIPEMALGEMNTGLSTSTKRLKHTFPHHRRTACVLCKRRRSKCDRNEPSCATCKRLGFKCEYLAKREESGPTRRYAEPLEARLKQVETHDVLESTHANPDANIIQQDKVSPIPAQKQELRHDISWMAQQNNGIFDPVLFGNIDEIQNSIMAEDFGSFFNDAFPLADLDAPNQASAADKDDETLPTETSVKFNANRIWDRLQCMEEFRDGEVDLDALCTELRAKAKSSEGLRVIDKDELDALLNPLQQKSTDVIKSGDQPESLLPERPRSQPTIESSRINEFALSERSRERPQNSRSVDPAFTKTPTERMPISVQPIWTAATTAGGIDGPGSHNTPGLDTTVGGLASNRLINLVSARSRSKRREKSRSGDRERSQSRSSSGSVYGYRSSVVFERRADSPRINDSIGGLRWFSLGSDGDVAAELPFVAPPLPRQASHNGQELWAMSSSSSPSPEASTTSANVRFAKEDHVRTTERAQRALERREQNEEDGPKDERLEEDHAEEISPKRSHFTMHFDESIEHLAGQTIEHASRPGAHATEQHPMYSDILRATTDVAEEATEIPRPKKTACVRCRSRKTKCDGNKPNCRACSSQGHQCEYSADGKKIAVNSGYLPPLEARLKPVENPGGADDDIEVWNLLAEYTTLTEEEISGVAGEGRGFIQGRSTFETEMKQWWRGVVEVRLTVASTRI